MLLLHCLVVETSLSIRCLGKLSVLSFDCLLLFLALLSANQQKPLYLGVPKHSDLLVGEGPSYPILVVAKLFMLLRFRVEGLLGSSCTAVDIWCLLVRKVRGMEIAELLDFGLPYLE